MHLDDRVTIATPEGVTLELVLAGLGSRFLARLLDSVIQVAIILALSFGAYVVDRERVRRRDRDHRRPVFLVLFAYDVPFEVLTGGRTVGKLAAGIRVVGRDGEPVGFLASAMRNISASSTSCPCSISSASISIVATQHSQRLGDLAGGTLVVRDRFGGRALDTTGRRAGQRAARTGARPGTCPPSTPRSSACCGTSSTAV